MTTSSSAGVPRGSVLVGVDATSHLQRFDILDLQRMLFGVGIRAWSLPALAVLVPLAAMDRPQAAGRAAGGRVLR